MHIYDLVLEGGRVVDPASGLDGIRNLAILDGRIAAIDEKPLTGRKKIDATGRVVAPGFIDIHSHVDGLEYAGLVNARMGVTTLVAGNCGSTTAPEGLHVRDFLDRVDGNFAVHQAFLAGAGDIRAAVGVGPYQSPDREQLRAMMPIAERVLEEGAVGLSFGIEYAPGTTAEELAGLGAVAGKGDRICPVHIRCGGPRIPFLKTGAPAAIREVLQAARKTKARFHISHIGGQIGIRVRPREALLEEGLRLVEEARAEGLDIESDMHPYAAGGTWISAALLDIFGKGFPFPLIIKHAVFLDIGMIEVGSGPHAGKRLDRSLFQEIRRQDPSTLVVLHFFDPGLIERVLVKSWVSFVSDGDFDRQTGAPSHPRCSGTFPRFLQWLVRERKLLGLSEALARMTIQPARRFKLQGKGHLGIGADADITIFDLATITDRASYANPDQAPEGISHVLVGGVLVLEDGALTTNRPGKAIRF